VRKGDEWIGERETDRHVEGERQTDRHVEGERQTRRGRETDM
jgi:hypothetical protein